MQALSRSLPLIVALISGLPCGVAAAERRAELVRYGDVQIEVIAEGEGPSVVLLPSLARDSEDYDQVAEGSLGCWVSRLAAEATRYRP